MAQQPRSGGPKFTPQGIYGKGGFSDVLSNRVEDIESREDLNPFKGGSNTPEALAEYMAPVMGMLGTVTNVKLSKVLDEIDDFGRQKLSYDIIADHPKHGRIKIAYLSATKQGKELYVEELFPTRVPEIFNPTGPNTPAFYATGPNKAGPSAIRSIWRQLKKDNPGVEKVDGTRITGARHGPAKDKRIPEGQESHVSLEVNPFTENLRRPKKPPTVREEMRAPLQSQGDPLRQILQEFSGIGRSRPSAQLQERVRRQFVEGGSNQEDFIRSLRRAFTRRE